MLGLLEKDDRYFFTKGESLGALGRSWVDIVGDHWPKLRYNCRESHIGDLLAQLATAIQLGGRPLILTGHLD